MAKEHTFNAWQYQNNQNDDSLTHYGRMNSSTTPQHQIDTTAMTQRENQKLRWGWQMYTPQLITVMGKFKSKPTENDVTFQPWSYGAIVVCAIFECLLFVPPALITLLSTSNTAKPLFNSFLHCQPLSRVKHFCHISQSNYLNSSAPVG